MKTSRICIAALVILALCVMVRNVNAQNPKPPTPEGWGAIQDAVLLEIRGTELIAHIDSTSNPDDQNKITTLEIKWTGEGGFNVEGCDFDGPFAGDFDVCTADKIAKVRTRGVGPEWSAGNIIPEGWDPFRICRDAGWIVDGSYLTGGTLDKFDENSPYINCIPEPSALTLLVLGSILCVRVHNQRRAAK